MEVTDKLATLGAAAQYDVCGYGGRYVPSNPLRFIYRSTLPGGGTVCLFKVLLTNVCVNDCAYCVNQVDRDCVRRSFQPDELARLFMELYRKRLVRGLFLSSGIGLSASRTMQSMIETVEILRQRYEFKDYVHLKILPGAPFDCVAEACKLANRVSINMEAPTKQHLARLSRRKDLEQGILERMHWVKQVMANSEGLVPSGQTTQFVVGAADETDRDILHATQALYREVDLRRAYFSAFNPVSNSRLEDHPATPPKREHRLYQMDWLVRVYGYSPGEVELAFDGKGNLRISSDPKQVIALKQPWLFPVDINRASYKELLRVPGIGPESAQRIIETRQEHSIFALEQLKKMGVMVKRATPFIWFQGMLAWEKQSSFLPELKADIPVPSLAETLV